MKKRHITKISHYEATRRCGFLLRAGWLFKWNLLVYLES